MKKSTMKKFSLAAVVLGLTVGGAGVLIRLTHQLGPQILKQGKIITRKHLASIFHKLTQLINLMRNLVQFQLKKLNLRPKMVNTFMKLKVLTHKMSTRQRLMQVVATLLN